MRKIILFLILVVSFGYLQAQVFTCDGDYTIVEPDGGVVIKNCSVSVYDAYAEIDIFDICVVVPVYDVDTIDSETINGKCWYLDKQDSCWIFNGYLEDLLVCVVSVRNAEGSWIFSRKIGETSIE